MLVIQGPQRDELMRRVADALLQIKKYGNTYGKHLSGFLHPCLSD